MKQLIINFLQRFQLKGKAQMGQKLPVVLYPAHTVHRKPPMNYQNDGFEHEFQQEIWEMRLHELENVRVYTSQGIVFKGRQVLIDSFISPEYQKTYFNFYHYLFLKLKGKKMPLPAEAQYVVANNVWCGGLFHWLLDALPRLYPLRERAKDLILLLPARYEAEDIKKGWTPFHKQSLEPFGFKAIIEMEEHEVAEVPKILFPSHAALAGNYNVAIMQGLRKMYHDYFVHQYPNRLANLGERIYVTRQKALWRKVKNEAEVVEVMKAHGFVVVNFEDYTFAEKLQIAYHARYYVGIFSSGQTMTAFMQAGSYLLDLRLKDAQNLAIYSLCDAVEVHYLYQTGEVADVATTDTTIDHQKWNMIVDIEKLKQNLALMIEAKA